jgi:hypothetical protein
MTWAEQGACYRTRVADVADATSQADAYGASTEMEAKMRESRTVLWRMGVVAPAVMMLVGCDGQKFQYGGESLVDRFPLDGERRWDYIHDDPDLYSLSVEKVNAQLTDGKEIVTLTYTAVDSDGGEVLLHEIDWSADADDGVEIWRWTDFTTDSAGITTDFSPPITFAERQMNAGDIVDTTAGGATYTTQYSGLQECPNNWSDESWECARITLTSDVGGEPFTGEYWIAMSYGTSWMEPAELGGRWTLSNAVFAAGG